MAVNYSLVVRHNGYWRGNVHTWSTVYPLVTTTEGVSITNELLDGVAQADSDLCWFGPGNNQGCVYEAAIYNKDAGGMAILTRTYGDKENPASGTLGSGTGWGAGEALKLQALEVAMCLTWSGGLGKTGKPVFFKKYYHAVPIDSTVDGGADIGGSAVAGLPGVAEELTTGLTPYGFALGNTRRLANPTPVLDLWYQNHQMPRGRRLKKLTSSSIKPGSYVVVSPDTE